MAITKIVIVKEGFVASYKSPHNQIVVENIYKETGRIHLISPELLERALLNKVIDFLDEAIKNQKQ